MNTETAQNIELPGGFAANPVIIKGEGAPVVYLHGPFGQEWDGFLDDLAVHRRVYAPAHAGAEADRRPRSSGRHSGSHFVLRRSVRPPWP